MAHLTSSAWSRIAAAILFIALCDAQLSFRVVAGQRNGDPTSTAASSSAEPLDAQSWCQAPRMRDGLLAAVASPLVAPGRAALAAPDMHACRLLQLSSEGAHGSGGRVLDITRLELLVGSGGAAATTVEGTRHSPGAAAAVPPALYALELLECDADLPELQGVEHGPDACLAVTASMRMLCATWPLSPPRPGSDRAVACAPPGTAFARMPHAQKRVLLLRTHWRTPAQFPEPSLVVLPDLQLGLSGEQHAQTSSLRAAPREPAVQQLGVFVGQGMFPPSVLAGGMQAFTIGPPVVPNGLPAARLACGKRCTYEVLSRTSPQHVTVVGYGFTTNDRGASVELRVSRGWAGRAVGDASASLPDWPAARRGRGNAVFALDEPFQLYPGDVVSWSCTYNTTGLPGGAAAALRGGYNAAPVAVQEQCSVSLLYWPRIDELRGCAAATDDDELMGENACSSEGTELLELLRRQQRTLLVRMAYDEGAFPPFRWMGGWKASHIVLELLTILATLWGSHMLLGHCTALGVWHKRYRALAPGQQRNVSLYVTHLLLDTAMLMHVLRPALTVMAGLTESTPHMQAGTWGFTYIVSCYVLELTWRRQVNTMLFVHHIGTVSMILVFGGELAPSTYRVANCLMVLAVFALAEQPTYVALLLKRMLPPESAVAVAAAGFGAASWFALKGLSAVIAARIFVEDWHIMQPWVRCSFTTTWIIAFSVQGWSGLIQLQIYRQAQRARARVLRCAGEARSSGGGHAGRDMSAAAEKELMVLLQGSSGSDEGNDSPGSQQSPGLCGAAGGGGSDRSDEDCLAAMGEDGLLLHPTGRGSRIGHSEWAPPRDNSAGADNGLACRLADLHLAAGRLSPPGEALSQLQLSPISSDSMTDGVGAAQSLGQQQQCVHASSSGVQLHRDARWMWRRTRSGVFSMMEYGGLRPSHSTEEQ